MTNSGNNTRQIFVVHGRNLSIRDAMFAFLGALDLRPIEWNQAIQSTEKPAPYIGEILDQAFAIAQAILVLLTGDDEVRLRSGLIGPGDPDFESVLTPQARPNVLFEAGLAFGRHPNRTILVEVGSLRPFSDIAGRHALRFRGTPEDRQALKERLRLAGCAVNDSGTHWLAAGNFGVESPVAKSLPSAVLDLGQDGPLLPAMKGWLTRR